MSTEYRGYRIFSQPRKGGEWVAKAVAPDGTEHQPFIARTQAEAEEQAVAKVRTMTFRDLDEEPLTEAELAERSPAPTPARPQPRRGLSRFLEER